jgi:hypothetical protein
MTVYVGLVKPYKEPLLNKLELFNEVSTLIISYHLFLFTDYLTDVTLQYQLGYALIVFTCFNVFINILTIFIQAFTTLKNTFTKLRSKCNKKNLLNKKALKYADIPHTNLTASDLKDYKN